MKIVHIYKDYHPVRGGVENHMRQLAEAQAALGHQVTVLVTSTAARASTETLNGVRVIKTSRQLNIQSAPVSISYPFVLRHETAGADIAHVHSPYPPGEAFNLWFGRAQRTVITWHSDIVRQKMLLRFYAPILRRVIAQADTILPTSDTYARSSPWLRKHLMKCVSVPLGIDTARFVATPAIASRAMQIRQSLLEHWHGLAHPTTLLLTVGRLRYYKGVDDLIRALPLLPDALAVVAGSGPMELPWRALAEERGVAERVVFTGDVSDADLPAYYHSADIYVLPANERAEAFGIAILEAMASGLPVVCTEVGTATSWINQHDVTGLVTPVKNPEALARSIQQLQRDSALRKRLGDAARQRVAAEFTQEQMIERVMQAYQQTLDRPTITGNAV